MAKKNPSASKQSISVKQAAENLGVTTRWIRQQIAEGLIAPARVGSKRNGRFALTAADIEALTAQAAEDPSSGGPAMLARFSRLEAERSNLLAQIAWERAIAQEQQKALEIEHARIALLADELALQRMRIEQLKALSAWDRVLGRHKAI